MCGEVPTPPEPKLILPGLAFAMAMKSARFFAGNARFVSMTLASFMVPATGVLSCTKSKGNVLVERGVDGVVRRDEADRIAIGRRRQHIRHADIAAGADAVLDDDRLAELLRQVLAEEAPDRVVGAAGRERNDEAYRPRRIIERSGRSRPTELATGTSRQRSADREHHGVSRSRNRHGGITPIAGYGIFFTTLVSRPNTRAALPPRMLRLAFSSRNGRS